MDWQIIATTSWTLGVMGSGVGGGVGGGEKVNWNNVKLQVARLLIVKV